MSWITLMISEFLKELINGASDLLGDLINNIFYWIVEIATQNAYIISAQKFIISLALAMIGLMVIKIVTSGYLLETAYDSEADPFNLLVKIAQTVAIITNAGWIFDFLLTMSKDFTNDLMNSADTSGFASQTNALLSAVSSLGPDHKAIAWNTLLVVVFVATIIFSVVAGLRGAELIAMNLFLPFFALDLLTNSREHWNPFSFAYGIAFFTYAFQIFFFVIALKCYSEASMLQVSYVIATIVWLILAIRCPRFLEKYLYKSGISNGATGGLRMLAQTFATRAMVR